MKICIYKTSSSSNKEIKEFSSLDKAVNTLFNDLPFEDVAPELIISKPDKYSSPMVKECNFTIEIYDFYRE